MAKPLAGKICLVTGATRGIGRGIAVQLGEAGATVYVTGRTLQNTSGLPGSLEDTAQEIVSRGGQCVPVQCDHNKDDQVGAVFEQIKREQDGQLDILVNNAYAAVGAISRTMGQPFWEADDNMWDIVNRVGLRNHYMCTVHAARMMVKRQQGLIVNISSIGGLKYLFNIPYGVGKAALDRMAADCAVELRKHKVSMVSLWPGAVKTELMQEMLNKADKVADGNPRAKQTQRVFGNAESPEFAGKVLVALTQDKDLLKKSGRILMASDLANEYKVNDVDGRHIPSYRALSTILTMAGWTKTAWFIPEFIQIPYFMVTLSGSKF